MGRWRDAADSVKPANGKAKGCDLYRLLMSLEPEERGELQQVIDHAVQTIANGDGRYSYIRDVIIAAGGPNIHPTTISKHVRGIDRCPTS